MLNDVKSRSAGNRDPVCGMVAKEEFKYEFKGKIFYFCSDLCKNEFQNSPDKYLKRRRTSEGTKKKGKKDCLFLYGNWN